MVFSALLLLLVSVVAASGWPQSNDYIVKDIASPECKPWLALPEGSIPEQTPDWQSACASLATFIYIQHKNVSSLAAYKQHIVAARRELALIAFGIWLALSFALYVVGWSIGWVIAGFRAKRA